MYYIKSFEVVKNGKNKFQSIENVVKNKIIKPNTVSFGVEQRLSTTVISKEYIKPYRPQGIIFKTK